MTTRDIVVRNKAGVHTRPSSMIVRTAAQYKSEVWLAKDGYEINAKSIIGVMTLAAEQGATLELRTDGPDEVEAADAMAELFESGFGEPIE